MRNTIILLLLLLNCNFVLSQKDIGIKTGVNFSNYYILFASKNIGKDTYIKSIPQYSVSFFHRKQRKNKKNYFAFEGEYKVNEILFSEKNTSNQLVSEYKSVEKYVNIHFSYYVGTSSSEKSAILFQFSPYLSFLVQTRKNGFSRGIVYDNEVATGIARDFPGIRMGFNYFYEINKTLRLQFEATGSHHIFFYDQGVPQINRFNIQLNTGLAIKINKDKEPKP